MSWAKIDDLLPHHDKLVRAGSQAPAVFGLYVASICYAQRQRTDGAIPRCALALLLPGAPRPSSRLIGQLVALRLWEVEGTGWRIHDYLAHNLSAEERRRGDLANAARQRDHRERLRHAVTNAVTNAVTEPVTNPVTNGPVTGPTPLRSSPLRSAPKKSSKTLESPSDSLFVRFWESYPKRVGKGAARKAWDRAKPSPAVAEAIVAAVDRQRTYLEREDGRYTPLPATWLNQRRWEDEPPDPGRPGDDGTRRRTAGINAWLEGQEAST